MLARVHALSGAHAVKLLTCIAVCGQAREQLSDAQWREDEIHAIVTQLHDEAIALSSAHAALQSVAATNPARAAETLDAVVVGMLGSKEVFIREPLINLYRPKGACAPKFLQLRREVFMCTDSIALRCLADECVFLCMSACGRDGPVY